MDQTLERAHAASLREAQPENDFERLLQKSFSPREILDGDSLDKMMIIAKCLSEAKMTVPKHLVGNIGDCLAIVTQAMLWNMSPFAVAQKTHIVNGALGYEAQLVNAVLQNSGAVRGLPQYEYKGENNTLECRVGFVPRTGGAVVWGEWLKSSDVTTKNSPLWKTNPKQQLGYLQLKNWARAFVPGAILGVYTVDELEDNLREPAAPRVTGMGVTTAAPQASGSAIDGAPAPAASAPATTALPAYDAAAFEKNLASWNGLIQSGKNSAQQILDRLATKAALTDDQIKRIRNLEIPPDAAPQADAGSTQPN